MRLSLLPSVPLSLCLSVSPSLRLNLSAFRSEAEHDVEMRRQFADARLFDRREIDDDGFANFGIANALEDRVALVSRVSLDVALGSKLLLSFHFDGEVNMRRATG